MDYDERRIPTFITIGGDQRNQYDSVIKSQSEENSAVEEQVSDTTLHSQVEVYINGLIEGVLERMNNVTPPTSMSDTQEETIFSSPMETSIKSEEFYTPRSDQEGLENLENKTQPESPSTVDDAENDDTFEFLLKELPVQEDSQSPLKPILSAQLLAEMDAKFDSLFNLDESAATITSEYKEEEEGGGDGDCSVLIEYTNTAVDDYISEDTLITYRNSPSPEVEITIETEDREDDNSTDIETYREEFPMTANIEETFNALLAMAEKEGDDLKYVTHLISDISREAKEEALLRAGLSDIEDIPGTELHRSLKTPDATKAEDIIRTASPGAVGGDLSSDDDETGEFVVIDHMDMDRDLAQYQELRERFNEETDIAYVSDVQPVIMEMQSKSINEGSSLSGDRDKTQARRRKRNKASAFFRRAASAIRTWRSKSWTPQQETQDERPHIEVITTSLEGGPVHLMKTKKILNDTEKEKEKSEIHSDCEIEVTDVPNKKSRRRFSGLRGTGSLPRNAERFLSFFQSKV